MKKLMSEKFISDITIESYITIEKNGFETSLNCPHELGEIGARDETPIGPVAADYKHYNDIYWYNALVMPSTRNVDLMLDTASALYDNQLHTHPYDDAWYRKNFNVGKMLLFFWP